MPDFKWCSLRAARRRRELPGAGADHAGRDPGRTPTSPPSSRRCWPRRPRSPLRREGHEGEDPAGGAATCARSSRTGGGRTAGVAGALAALLLESSHRTRRSFDLLALDPRCSVVRSVSPAGRHDMPGVGRRGRGTVSPGEISESVAVDGTAGMADLHDDLRAGQPGCYGAPPRCSARCGGMAPIRPARPLEARRSSLWGMAASSIGATPAQTLTEQKPGGRGRRQPCPSMPSVPMLTTSPVRSLTSVTSKPPPLRIGGTDTLMPSTGLQPEMSGRCGRGRRRMSSSGRDRS